MIAEGLVALIWAAAAIAFTGGYGELSEYMAAHNGAGDLVADISVGWLGTFGGVLAILGVVAAPITTGDTALRSARLIAADVLHIDQSKLMRRLMVSLPLFAIAFGLMCIDFNILWRYFAWTNQLLAAFTLWAATVYLARHRRLYIVTLIPAFIYDNGCRFIYTCGAFARRLWSAGADGPFMPALPPMASACCFSHGMRCFVAAAVLFTKSLIDYGL